MYIEDFARRIGQESGRCISHKERGRSKTGKTGGSESTFLGTDGRRSRPMRCIKFEHGQMAKCQLSQFRATKATLTPVPRPVVVQK